ncbi:MAG: hypothetical protein QOJ29_3280, partial [Thermoleophilaceae bacterium]|nr:hypothetical protein [Thermoleophilaceae bacterium]
CLLLKAEGLSYHEICATTGWTYTKVNRCLTEGRRAFLKRVAGIQSGAECERLAPLISKAADGEASADEMRLVRPHLKSCLACKATLREYRATPARVAGLVPPVVAIAGGGGDAPGFMARLLERFTGMGDAAGAKVAAVAASAVVLAGGSAAGLSALHHDPPAVAPSAFAQAQAEPEPSPTPAPPPSAPDPSAAAIQAVSTHTPAPPSAPVATSTPTADEDKPAAADPTPEFDPGTQVAPTVKADVQKSTPKRPSRAGGEFGP